LHSYVQYVYRYGRHADYITFCSALKTYAGGQEKYSTLNIVSTKFSRLIKNSRPGVPKGTDFYMLRRTAAAIVTSSGDFAVVLLFGHADLQTATGYVQDIYEQMDGMIGNSIQCVIQGDYPSKGLNI